MAREVHPDYNKVHQWLRYYFGKALKCEFCGIKDATYNWALKRECDYEKKRDNFLELCRSCHAKYDCTDDTRAKMSEIAKRNGNFLTDTPSKKGKKLSKEHKNLIKINCANAIKVIDTETGMVFLSIEAARLFHKVKYITIKRVLEGFKPRKPRIKNLKYYEQ